MTRPNIQAAVTRIQELPTLPTVLSKILATAADPDASALDLGEHIQADQSLSAALLKVVNSAYYGVPRQIKSVTQAIVMLGFLEVRNLTLTATAFRTLGPSNSNYDRLQLWRHSLATALACEKIAQRLRLDGDGNFEAGLLHDIGKVVLDLLYPQQFQEAARIAHEREVLIWEVEREQFGLDHAEVGALLAEHWNLPAAVVDAIRCHHHPETSRSDPRLTAVAAVGNHVATAAGIGELSNGRAVDYPTVGAQQLQIDAATMQSLIDDMDGVGPRVDEMLGALKKR